MKGATYEFPLSEKVRNYLRLEQLFQQLDDALPAATTNQELHFFDVLFDVLEVIERLDLRADFIRDLDQQQRNLEHWSKHPNVDERALQAALATINKLSADIKQTSKLSVQLKEDKFLATIRQRFSIPGGATCFDLPSLFCWMKQAEDLKNKDRNVWLSYVSMVKETILLLLTFLRERGRFEVITSKNGFFQGNANDKTELVRVQCDSSSSIYPILSGNTYRYGIKFMQLDTHGNSTGVDSEVVFKLAKC